MRIPRQARHWTALIGWWTLAAAVAWIVSVQGFLVLMSPFGDWQVPAFARVVVTSVDRDPDSLLTDNVTAQQGDRERYLRMPKAECRQIRPQDEIWVLDNYFAGGLRPDHFRLTPLRLLLEFPEPLWLLAFWGIRRVRKAQGREKQEELERPRKVWKDEFHLRAERFAAKDDNK
jgi:hypothetical protein